VSLDATLQAAFGLFLTDLVTMAGALQTNNPIPEAQQPAAAAKPDQE